MSTAGGRITMSGLGAFVLLLAGVAVGQGSEPAGVSPVVGRFAVDSAVGGAVWAFQPGGRLIVVGPGDLITRGTWTEGPETGELDARLTIADSGQGLTILGAISPDGQEVALYVAATDAVTPDGWTPWPPVSRLLGERLVPLADAIASPTPMPLDCLRPSWASEAAVDWDRCDGAELSPTPSAEASPGV